jgi:Mn-dependent DtxR family transcriptional regulator
MAALNLVFVLLYDENGRSVAQLQSAVEYANSTMFRSILKELHRKRYIEVAKDDVCTSTTKGIAAAEEIIRKLKDKPF